MLSQRKMGLLAVLFNSIERNFGKTAVKKTLRAPGVSIEQLIYLKRFIQRKASLPKVSEELEPFERVSAP